MRRTAALVLSLLALAPSARAQGAGRAGGANRPARDELFKMIDAYIISNLQESLGLSDEQFVKILPLVKKLRADRRDHVERRRETMAEMRRLLESGTATDAGITALMKTLRDQEAEEPVTLRRDMDAVDALLTPVQQAKLRLLEARVEQRLRELVRQPGAGRQQREGRPGAGDDLP